MQDRLPMTVTPLENFPPMEEWDDWTEYDANAWPKKVERRYRLVPTTCFNCEAACGLVAYIDKETGKIRKLEGNPHHPGSRGRNCAKGPATLNQIEDTSRILYPLKRVGERGSGKFERTTWDEVLDTFATKIRTALQEGRHNEIMYHVGRPGADGYMDRVLRSWGVDAHNSHTNVCSSGARVGYALWTGADRPSPDHENAKFILLLSAHLETGHYFNPHAQRIIDAKEKGTKLCAVDVRLSNTASIADYWLSPYPGTEAMMLLAMAKIVVDEGYMDEKFVKDWVNWRDYLAEVCPNQEPTFPLFVEKLRAFLNEYTVSAAEKECGVPADKLIAVAHEIGRAGSAFASHVWRNAAAGNLGGWQVARTLQFLTVLVGAVGTPGGTELNSRNKFVAAPFLSPPQQKVWNELLYPREYPLAYHEMSILLPHFLEEGRGKIAAYFTRVYNPVWTNPDGLMWEKLLRDESKIELHAALTPTWSETAQYADYVLPMGLGAERHDLMSQETHAARWISFRQPVLRVSRERDGETFEHTYEANPGEVWEEDEFWIELSWRIDPDGSLGIRKYYESPYRPGKKITIDEYYAWIFENSVPGLKEEAAKKNMSPLEYMRRHGAFLVDENQYEGYKEVLDDSALKDADIDGVTGSVTRDGTPIGVVVDGKPRVGFNTPSRRLEFLSTTMGDWKWPEHTLPGYIKSHVHRDHLNVEEGRYVLVPTFRLPTLIHTRSSNSKWLYELSNTNPVWIHPEDAARIGVETTDLVRITTRIGHYVNKVWVTEGMRPGVVACSHHLGRWRLSDDTGPERWGAAKVIREDLGDSVVRFRRIEGIKPFKSKDPDSSRIWWTDGGVHQNLTFPVQPDPISGMNCWHQIVTVERAHKGDQYADVQVDTSKSMEVYREWLAMTRPAPGPDNLRRPLWFARAVRPDDSVYRIDD
ncbi:MAG: molybdopterin-dependent oxidoreductase [Planctomycetes bacterium]|nr:molybdopterin-dependent oxidoreductase [Planctomycetota bacterium]